MNKLTYFAVAEGGIPVEIDIDLARDLYKSTTLCGDNSISWPKAEALLEAGEKVHPGGDPDMYVFGKELSTKERFKMALKEGIQTNEEYRKNVRRGK